MMNNYTTAKEKALALMENFFNCGLTKIEYIEDDDSIIIRVKSDYSLPGIQTQYIEFEFAKCIDYNCMVVVTDPNWSPS